MVDLALDSHEEGLASRAAELAQRGAAVNDRLIALARNDTPRAADAVLVARETGRGVASLDALVALMTGPGFAHPSPIGLAASDSGSDCVVVGAVEPALALVLDDVVSIVEVSGAQRLQPLDPDSEVVRCRLGRIVFRGGPDSARRARLVIAAAAAGIAQATTEASAAFAMERIQFGRPIGINQAIKHRCADMAIQAEASWSVTSLAAVLLDAADPDTSRHIDASRVVACRAALANAASNIQNHGAEGTRGDRLPHLYLKRAHVLAAVGGGWRQAAQRLGP